jgi:hypothetical protein
MGPSMSTQNIPISKLRIDGDTQTRSGVDQEAIADYAAAMVSGTRFPPGRAVFDGENYWLFDGFHRYFAHQDADLLSMECEIVNGTKDDAQLLAFGVNDNHGLRLTREDKWFKVKKMLSHAVWGKWSNREVALRCNVTHPFVAKVRSSLETFQVSPTASGDKARVVTTKHGTTVEMDTSRIGRKPDAPADKPLPSLETLPAKAPVHPIRPAPAPADPDMQDEAEILQELEDELKVLRTQVAAITAEDPKAELLKLQTSLHHAQRRQSELMDRAAELERNLKWMARQLQRIGNACGESDHTKIAAAVEAKFRVAA